MDFFTRYGTSWQTTSTVLRPVAMAARKAHAVRLGGVAGAASVCGRTRIQGDIDERGHDFAEQGFPARCAVCAGMVTAFTRSTH